MRKRSKLISIFLIAIMSVFGKYKSEQCGT